MKICSYCGRENAEDALRCRECGSELEVIAAAPAVSAQNKSPSAGFAIRALARILDAVCGLFVGFAAGVLSIMIIRSLNALAILPAGWQYRLHRFSWLSLGFGLLGSIAYHVFCEGIHGATLGKLCCQIRVVSEDGKPASLRGALIRTLAYYVDSLFFGLVGYTSMQKSPLNQRYGDVWGKTVVVKVTELSPESQQTDATQFALGLLAGLACWITLLTAGLVVKVL